MIPIPRHHQRRDLKHQVQEDAEWMLARDPEAKRLSSEVGDLRRKVTYLEARVASINNAREACCRSVPHPIPTGGQFWDGNSRNPLSHLLALNFALEPSNSPLSAVPSLEPGQSFKLPPSTTDTDVAVGTPYPRENPILQSTGPLLVKSKRKHRLLLPDHPQN